jgi:hypothetical protein
MYRWHTSSHGPWYPARDSKGRESNLVRPIGCGFVEPFPCTAQLHDGLKLGDQGFKHGLSLRQKRPSLPVSPPKLSRLILCVDRFRKADLAAFRAMIKRYAANLAQEHPPALAAPEPATA